jgi:zinc transport system ATP-binding protein
MSASALRFEGVDYAFGVTPALIDVSLHVSRGEFLALVGPNGGGKSTLLKLALGLLEPGAGRVEVLGTEPRRARARVGYVPQFAGFPRDFPVTVGEAVLHGRLGLRPWWRALGRQDRQAAAQALLDVEAQALSERSIAALSGGELQRVLIARALATEPQLLLLDEPTAHVDTRAEAALFELLARLRRRMAIVIVSHDVGLVSRHVDRIACLNRRLVCHGTAPLDARTLQRLYGMPVRLVEHRSRQRHGETA